MKDIGFWFNYKNHHLSRSKEIGYLDMQKINESCCCCEDGVNLYVHCDKCDTFMEFFAGGSDVMLDGFWKCPKCGIRVKQQRTVYFQLDKENLEDPDYNS